jgi:hypothetical protein
MLATVSVEEAASNFAELLARPKFQHVLHASD